VRTQSFGRPLLSLFAVFCLFIAACGSDDATDDAGSGGDETSETEETTATTEAADSGSESTDDTEPEVMEEATAADATFISAQFAPVEEAEKMQAILDEIGATFNGGEEGPTIDQILAGTGEIDVFGALHGAFPTLARDGALTNMADALDDLSADRTFAPSMVDAGLLGTDDFLHYVPWAQATYIMAAHNDALVYLPEGADVQAITWDELAQWCQNILDGEGTPKCGLPHAGLFHRFLEGYLFPSFTGGMASEFRSDAAVDMMTWSRDVLWPTMNPESINYDFMQVPLLSGDVWVAFDHTARLIDAFEQQPDDFIGFPAPAGPMGRGFMPVIVGLGVPVDAPNPEAGLALIDYLTQPGTQGEVLAQLGFYPVVDGVDSSNLPIGIQIEADTVAAQANAPDALPALLPIGLGDRGGEINEIFRGAFDRIVFDGEDVATVLDEQGDLLQTLFDETGAPCWAPDPLGDGPCVVNPAG
jgi:multiple sugar transport system substrate-binding protein